MSFCCPCVVFGQNVETLSKDECLLGGNCQVAAFAGLLGIFLSPAYAFLVCFERSAIRKKYQLEGGDVSDCCCALWCTCCVLIQVTIPDLLSPLKPLKTLSQAAATWAA